MGPKKQAKNVVQQVQKEPEVQIPPHELTGFGRFEYLSGVIYQGRWKIIKNSKVKHGFGVLTIPSTATSLIETQMYEGNWEDDVMEGYGVYRYSDGSIYEGQWKKNKHHGRGLLKFANGTKYQGQWINHMMHGTGVFQDHNGRRWGGEYRNGVFESRMQTELIKEKTISSRKYQVQKQVLLTIDNMISKIKKTNKETIVENISPFFVRSDDAKLLIKEPYAHYNDKQPQKWEQILTLARNGSFKILSHSSQSVVLQPEQILSGQLQGIGQIIQLNYEKEGESIKLVFLQKQISRWVIVAIQQNKK